MSSPLYRPHDAHSSATFRFLNRVNAKYSLNLTSYSDLYHWSISAIDDFWGTVWDETGIIGDKGNHVVDRNAKPSDNPMWFSHAQLNWAENMLKHRSASQIALIQAMEPTPEYPSPPLKRLSYGQLYTLVADLVSALLYHGIQPGDRVASYSSNCIENVAACLAATAISAIWVSAAADFGPEGVLERFEQVQPKVIFTVDAVVYNAKVHNHISKLESLLAGMNTVNAKPKVVIVSTGLLQGTDRAAWDSDWADWEAFVRQGQDVKLGCSAQGEITWHRGNFNDPLWILFSSGTTGRPKPIVHRSGGMLLQARKEFAICADLRPEDVFFYYTTTGWMMWNFLVSGLASGCSLVLYDGSPLRQPEYLWNLVDELGISIFGTSAKYIDQLSKKYSPKEHHSLQTLRHIYSTGSPLAPQLFDWVYNNIHPNVLLGSITGGTDICSLFAGMNSALPVFKGEIQCRMLGMAIEAYGSEGTANPPDVEGELVCVNPFPCMPIGFWPLPGFGSDEAVKAAQVRFQDAYFTGSGGVWYHGDHVLITKSKEGNGGGVVMLGRSDGVLNPGGVRFGSAELYDVIDAHFADSIEDCVAAGQSIDNGTDERVILFVKLPKGHELSSTLVDAICAQIKQKRTPRHVPSKVIQVRDIPYTLNSKRVEVLVKKIINGAPLSIVNPATLLNPQCLESYAEIGATLRGELLDTA
ncbi:acetoacyl-CoA synthetase [Rhodocollybia butyracea]|uniref:Acetoacyl-CoA synthetase n=1 Tax=Rhodocollybia butyracea TaxID=206335 RepID=A0A9P5Q6Z8_9AGAR|nr:acetoacyl-CoA synthetase [Rhodocollybia butyracea]